MYCLTRGRTRGVLGAGAGAGAAGVVGGTGAVPMQSLLSVE